MEKDVAILLSNLKLALQKIIEFSGRIEDWQKWKNRTSCALVGSGYNVVLKKKKTVVVYLQLAMVTSGGTAYHLVKAHEKEKDGYEELGNILNEGWSEIHVFNVFFKGITDTSCKMLVMIQRSKTESLDDA
eukprot:1842887-Ditylum_brightwellii.AAC.1